MQVKSIAECSKSILQYFLPSLSLHLSLRSLFCLFSSCCFTQVLSYRKFSTFTHVTQIGQLDQEVLVLIAYGSSCYLNIQGPVQCLQYAEGNSVNYRRWHIIKLDWPLCSNMHAQLSSGARSLIFGLGCHVPVLSVGSAKALRLCECAGSFSLCSLHM